MIDTVFWTEISDSEKIVLLQNLYQARQRFGGLLPFQLLSHCLHKVKSTQTQIKAAQARTHQEIPSLQLLSEVMMARYWICSADSLVIWLGGHLKGRRV